MGKGYGRELTKGILKENPVFRLVLGTCPTLAVSTSAMSALGTVSYTHLRCSMFIQNQKVNGRHSGNEQSKRLSLST